MKHLSAIALLSVFSLFHAARAEEPIATAPTDDAAEAAPVAPSPAKIEAKSEPKLEQPAELETPEPDQSDEEPATEPAPPAAEKPPVAPSRPRIVDDGTSRLDKKEDIVLGGKHWRIKTAQGAVHVWAPPGYDRETAGTVVYVHGYFTDADGAWRDHELAKQFKASRQNALFIVPDAPAGNDQHVRWPALSDLRRAVTRANIKLPGGAIVVVGHSGAFRTVMEWVDHRQVDHIILLDALYSGEAAFDEFIHSGKRADQHKLIVIGADTAQDSAGFVKKYKFARAREKMPPALDGFTKAERRVRLLYIRSQYDHMSIVTSQKVIPLLLRLTRLKAL